MPAVRLLAVTCLIDILDKAAKPKQTLDAVPAVADERDRALLREIVYGVTRYRDTLDWVLGHFLKQPSRLGPFTLNNLRAAVYQIFFMRVPDWAAVNEAVEAEKNRDSGAAGKPGLVNGVLRNIIRQRDHLGFPFKIKDPVSSITVNTSHPRWLVRRWVSRFGVDEASALAGANNAIAPLTIRVNTLKTTRDELIRRLSERGIAATAASYSPDGILLSDVRSYDAISFLRGFFIVQDEASQLVSFLLSPARGERVLDACAAPGGKTTHLAQIMGDSGEIVAVEADARRIPRLTDNITALGISSVRVVHADITETRDPGSFDRILVDAPCSAFGVIRRNPDIKYRRQEEDLKAFASKQSDILKAASRLLRPGGTMVYSVCSTEPEEGEEVVSGFLKTEREFRIIDTEALFLKNFTGGGFFRTYPHRHAMDGFFGVKLCRKK